MAKKKKKRRSVTGVLKSLTLKNDIRENVVHTRDPSTGVSTKRSEKLGNPVKTSSGAPTSVKNLLAKGKEKLGRKK